MTKEEAKSKLKKLGYTVVDDNSIVTVVIPPGTSMKNTIKSVKESLYEWGYNASFSVKQHKGVDEVLNPENTTDMVESQSLDETIEDVESIDTKEPIEPIEAKAKTDTKKNKNKKEEAEDEYYDEEDSDMLLTEESFQFSLEDFGLDF